MKNIYEVASANKRKSAIILVLFVLFIGFSIYIISQAVGFYLGYELSGLGVAGVALIISGLMSFGGYYFSDRIVLSISRARPADRNKEFNFFTACENLSLAADIPKPRLFVIEDTALNAFATGRNPEHAVICITSGLIDSLDRTELEGVIFAILSPIIAQLIKLAISRRREFMADAGAVELTRQPLGLILALTKISNDHEPLEAANKATAHLYIANPFKDKIKGGVGWFSGLFNTHPPIEERIKVLQQMA
ncbi:MAG: heat shock protein HtpX [Candidatus Woesebacteria bacterium GW2011_GWB1_38_5b]|uniref:Heat shock protein HtpX n=1 Tax=Candidatus Woesebacteria bacterium GW2011_GWB1_38_5b TaxID=1618569 RepID=A0A0G0MN00_9BACT|nr:MAG: heat shock protein HtpX [Candidatus Woesebacteria bacterium GW2011_GWB1_38_5b]